MSVSIHSNLSIRYKTTYSNAKNSYHSEYANVSIGARALLSNAR